jgi:hypothetical protein
MAEWQSGDCRELASTVAPRPGEVQTLSELLKCGGVRSVGARLWRRSDPREAHRTRSAREHRRAERQPVAECLLTPRVSPIR